MKTGVLARLVPWMISGTAVLHVVVGLVLPNPIGEMVGEGLAGSVGSDPERAFTLWYLVAGLGLLTLGELARWTVRETGRVPARLGWWLLGSSLLVILLMPASGGWLIAALGVLSLIAARGNGRNTGAEKARVRAARTDQPSS
jgi:Family of unknown function (DUF6463)